MDINQKFSIELNQELTSSDYINLRKLYLPLIETKSVLLYEILSDLNDENYLESHNFKSLFNRLSTNLEEIKQCLINLEAVGLIDHYVKNDDSHAIISLNQPLNPNKFDKNTLLKTHLINKIGIQGYEKIIYSYKKPILNKSNYIDITKKYQDVFLQDFEKLINENDNFYTTLDLKIEAFPTHDENIKKLPSTHFIKYLLNRNVSFDENVMINHLLKLGFNDPSINLFIDFCLNKNNKIVKNYIIKIANDFHSRSIISFSDVLHELSIIANSQKAKKSKQLNSTIFDFNKTNSNYENENNLIINKNNQLTIDVEDVITLEELKEMI